MNGAPRWLPDNLNYDRVVYFFWLLTGLSAMNMMFCGENREYEERWHANYV